MATVKSVWGGYMLPDGLPESSTVRLLSFESGWYEVEFGGRMFNVFMACVTVR
jgi:hypothetical protein